MKFERTKVFNFEGAFRGMRNPMNSWQQSDSFFGIVDDYDENYLDVASEYAGLERPEYYENNSDDEDVDYDDKRIELEDKYAGWLIQNGELDDQDTFFNVAYLGPRDLNLAQRLIKAGPEHRKFMRQIFVCVDITAPLYLWKELDTYRVGVTANSTSTMHKLASTPITLKCFETDDWNESYSYYPNEIVVTKNSKDNDIVRNVLIPWLEELRKKYNETKDKKYWKELVRWLPESWLQTRTVTMSYENLRNMYFQRKDHKLTEWHSFCEWIELLPYAKELICFN